MKHQSILIILAVALSTSLGAGSGGRNSTPHARDITELSWMTGSWQTAAGGRAQIEEHWTQAAAGSMMGMSRTISGSKTVEFEYLRIEQREDAIYYVAQPKGRCPATDFKLTRVSESEAVFENPSHDFPKRISYKKTGDDSLTASIDGGEGTRQMTFSFRRMR